MARTAFEEALLSGANLHAGAKHSDGSSPHNYWVSRAGSGDGGGNDGLGNGSYENPFATPKRAVRQSRDARGDRILVMSGNYADTIDIGSGGTGYGSSGGYAKSGLQIIGDDTVHNGRVQIVGDGVTAAPTLRVLEGYLGGFVLKNVELDVTTVTQPALHLQTSNAASGAQTNLGMRFLVDNIAVRSGTPTVGILFEGAQEGRISNITMQGPTIGLAFCGSTGGSTGNFPNDLDLVDIDFRDCVTADIASVASAAAPTTILANIFTNLSFLRMRHWDRGGTPVTHYVNFPNVAGNINVHFFDCFTARDVADDTLIAIPADVVWIGRSAAAAEFIIGA